MSTSETYTGACLCRRVRYRVGGGASGLCVCHCESCRRATGGAYVAWATFPAEEFEITSGTLTEVRSSQHVVRGHCADCGTALTYRRDSDPDEIDITTVTVDGSPAELAPQVHLWVADKAPWVVIGDGLPQFPGRADGSE